jgi:hypothetical protein
MPGVAVHAWNLSLREYGVGGSEYEACVSYTVTYRLDYIVRPCLQQSKRKHQPNKKLAVIKITYIWVMDLVFSSSTRHWELKSQGDIFVSLETDVLPGARKAF